MAETDRTLSENPGRVSFFRAIVSPSRDQVANHTARTRAVNGQYGKDGWLR